MLWFLRGRGAVSRPVSAALVRRARQGVRVRVLLDGYGSKGIDPRLVAELRAAGCLVFFYRPLKARSI